MPVTPVATDSIGPAADIIFEWKEGDKVFLQVSIDLPVNLAWRDFIRLMNANHSHWISFSGMDSVRRMTRPEILSCVTIIRGDKNSNVWQEAEGTRSVAAELRNEIAAACKEVQSVIQLTPAVAPDQVV